MSAATSSLESSGPSSDREVHYGYMLPALDDLIARVAAGHGPPVRIVDVGCGSGAFAIDFARRVADSGGHVTGVDISGSALASATMRADCLGITNVTFVQADVSAGGGTLPFSSDSFDLVHVHQVLAHLPQPVKVIRELLRVAKKETKNGGGVVCLREGDLESARFSPASTVLDECFDIVRRVHRAEGGEVTAGRHLSKWALKAGASKKKMTSRQPVWRCDTRAAREAYGGHWPARCSYGMFADKAMALGVTQ